MKVLLLPIMLVIFVLRVLVKIGIELSSIVIGGLMLIVLGCITYAFVQQMWPSVWILVAMEGVLIMVTCWCRNTGCASGRGGYLPGRPHEDIKK